MRAFSIEVPMRRIGLAMSLEQARYTDLLSTMTIQGRLVLTIEMSSAIGGPAS